MCWLWPDGAGITRLRPATLHGAVGGQLCSLGFYTATGEKLELALAINRSNQPQG